MRTNPICDSPLSRWSRRNFPSLQRSRRNHRSQTWPEAPSGRIFVTSQRIIVCYTAVFSVVTQRSSRDNTKHGCGCIADSTDIVLRNETKTAALTRSTQQLRRFPFVRTGRLDKSVSKWNRLFSKGFAEKPPPSCILFRIWLIWLNSFD